MENELHQEHRLSTNLCHVLLSANTTLSSFQFFCASFRVDLRHGLLGLPLLRDPSWFHVRAALGGCSSSFLRNDPDNIAVLEEEDDDYGSSVSCELSPPTLSSEEEEDTMDVEEHDLDTTGVPDVMKNEPSVSGNGVGYLFLPCASTSSSKPGGGGRINVIDMDDDLPSPCYPPEHVDQVNFAADDIVWVKHEGTYLPGVVYRSYKFVRQVDVKFIAGAKRGPLYSKLFKDLLDFNNPDRNAALLEKCITIDPSAQEACDKILEFWCISYAANKCISASDYLTSATPLDYFDIFSLEEELTSKQKSNDDHHNNDSDAER